MKLVPFGLLILALGLSTASCGNRAEEESATAADSTGLIPEPTIEPDATLNAEAGMDTAGVSTGTGAMDAVVGNDDRAGGSAAGNSSTAKRSAASVPAGAGNGSVGTASSGTRGSASPNATGGNTPNNTNRRTWSGNDDRSIRESTTESQSSVGGASHPTNIPDRGLNSPR